MTRATSLALMAALAACSPPPRAVAYFRAHTGEAATVIVECDGGWRRGPECANAELAIAEAQSAARMGRYKQSF